MPETIVRFDDRRPIPAAVFIGNENDNLVESVAFELADWLSEAIVYIYLTANGKSDVVNLGTERVFDVTRTHTREAGRWEAYLEAYLNGDRVWHSDEFAMYVGALPAIGEQIEQQYPTAIEDALKAAEALTGLKARAETLPEGSEPTVRFDEEAGEIVYGLPLGPKGDAGFSPTIRTTAVSGGYEISITNPDGSMSVFTVTNGMSPTVRVSKIDGGNRVTITDASGPKTFDVMDGKDGTGGDVTAESITAALGYTPASKDDVSNVNEGVYELIETITLEEAAVVDRTTEPDGTPYKFKAVLAFIETSGALAATNLYYYSGSTAVTLSPIVKKDTTTLSRIVLECVQQYGYWIGKWRSSWTTSGTTGTNESYITRINTHTATNSVKDHPYITRCRTSGELPTGTIVYIWGVRADG